MREQPVVMSSSALPSNTCDMRGSWVVCAHN